jgi:phosphatidylglycerophosphatase A
MDRLGVVLATCAYVGYVPIAPGTFGSAAGLAMLWLLRGTGSGTAEAAAIVAVLFVGVWSASAAERHFRRVDPGHVVIDEVFGMLVTLAFIPVGVAGALVGFFIFRALDIIKPWPARRLEALPGGWGIMADDGMAALYGNLIMRALMAFAPGWIG